MISEPEKYIYFSIYPAPTLINLSHLFTSTSKPAAQKSFTVLSANSAPALHHLRFSNVLERIYRTSCETLYATNTSHTKQEILFFMNISCIEPFCPQIENAQQSAAFQHYTPQARLPFWLLKAASEHENVRVLPELSWSWLCCYSVTCIGNLSRPLQPFYSHLCPAYWLSVVTEACSF
jgi:hypothetical protein